MRSIESVPSRVTKGKLSRSELLALEASKGRLRTRSLEEPGWSLALPGGKGLSCGLAGDAATRLA
jgi:hypothetical protein